MERVTVVPGKLRPCPSGMAPERLMYNPLVFMSVAGEYRPPMSSAQPRIAILTPYLHHASGYGGITPWMVNLANGFVARGMAVDILVNARPETPLSCAGLDAPARILNHGYHKPGAMLGLLSYLHRARPQVLLGAGHRYNWMAAWAKRLSRTPVRVFLSVHENVSVGSAGMPAGKQRRRFAAMRRLYPRCNGVIAVSEGVARDLVEVIGLPEDVVGTIYNPVVDDALLIRSREAVDHPWLQAGEPPVILGVGRLEQQKDFPTLLRAFAALQARLPSRLVILGEGRGRAALEVLSTELGIAGRVALPGHVDNPFAWMRQADLFVLSSAWEGFGNVLAEALAVGTPVVSTDCPSGPREILADGRYGSLTPVGDVAALCEAMAVTLAEPLSEKILHHRGMDFSIEASVRRYLSRLGF